MSGALIGLVGFVPGTVDISGGFDVSDTVAAPTSDLTVGIEFQSDGDIHFIASTGSVDSGDWIEPKAAAPGDFEIMFEQNSGDAVSVDALDTWLPLTSSRSCSITQSGGAAGSKAANVTVSIRVAGVVVSVGTLTLAANVI